MQESSPPSPSAASVTTPEGFVLNSAPIKLNVGSGGVNIPGFTNIDIENGIEMSKLPYPDNSVDTIYASHVLEHVPHRQCGPTLKEWNRVLKPGGTLMVAVPTLELIDRAMQNPNTPRYMRDDWTFGGHVTQHDVHHQHFTRVKLEMVLKQAGFRGMRSFEPFVNDCSRAEVSLNMECHKAIRRPRSSYTNRVTCVISQAYLTYSPMMESLMSTVMSMPFPTVQHHGAFWDKSLSAGIKLGLKNDPEYLLTIDHDSVFTPQDVGNMLRIMDANPDIMALFPVQMSRHDDKPLVFREGVEYNGEFTQVPFGHFGLTLIRSSLFEDLPKPWFWSVPGPDGDWDSYPQSDSDITFWRTLMEHGHKVAQANNVVLGHMILSVKWPHPTGGIALQPIQNYQANGRPNEAIFNWRTYTANHNTPYTQVPAVETSPAVAATSVATGEVA
jgi:predicted SAM-dependent methyltransferase